MILENDVIYRTLTLDDCSADLLRDFNRYQEVNRCWRKENGKWILKDIHFIEQWDDSQKKNKISSFVWSIEHGGVTLGAFKQNRLIGFATIGSDFFGCNNEYILLGMLHVSYENRNKGIGRKLFAMSCDRARQIGAKKIYISAHSSEESQAFYKAVGCTETKEVNQKLAEKEPCDCQLEYVLQLNL